ncbi:MAG: Fe-S cluster assembly sulfur transfer protein SufU [Candidatus Margulisiibacteriota bacterium]
MSRLEQLYQDTVLVHNKNPKNFKEVDYPTHVAHGKNPLCGDDYWLYLKIEDNRIVDLGFQGSGCAISKSSASLMTQTALGKTPDEILALKDHFIDLLTQDPSPEAARTGVGSLKIFETVKNYPVRVKCATLIWRALEKALTTGGEISTE